MPYSWLLFFKAQTQIVQSLRIISIEFAREDVMYLGIPKSNIPVKI